MDAKCATLFILILINYANVILQPPNVWRERHITSRNFNEKCLWKISDDSTKWTDAAWINSASFVAFQRADDHFYEDIVCLVHTCSLWTTTRQEGTVCKLLAFNGIRRTDSILYLAGSLRSLSPLLSLRGTTGAYIALCYRSFSCSREAQGRTRVAARCKFVTPARRIGRSATRERWVQAAQKNRSRHRGITIEPRTKRRARRETWRRDDLIIGPACTLTNFRESVVKGAEKPERREQREGRKGTRRAWKRRPRSKFRQAPSGCGSCGNSSINRRAKRVLLRARDESGLLIPSHESGKSIF